MIITAGFQINTDHIDNHDSAHDYATYGQNFHHKVSSVRLVAMSKMLIYLENSAYSATEKPLV